MLKEGYYITRGYYIAHLTEGAIGKRGAMGVVKDFGLVAYDRNGIFPYKDEHKDIGDAFDLVLESWTTENIWK